MREPNKGIITDKTVLPITRLNFGFILPSRGSSSAHTLGRFECTGQVAVNGMPKSCNDLWRIGHFLSGFYSVMGENQIESIYCDFSKLPTDLGIGNCSMMEKYLYIDMNNIVQIDLKPFRNKITELIFVIFCRFSEVDWV